MIKTDLIAPISELLERQARQFPDKVAFADSRRQVTFAELNRLTNNLAAGLRANGLAAGGTVAIWLPNCVEWVIACLAIVRAQGIMVPISYEATPTEAAYRLDDARCEVLVTKGENASKLGEVAALGTVPSKQVFVGPAPSGIDFFSLCEHPPEAVENICDNIDGPSYIIYTSGTTGRPKGVVLSSRALLWATAACWSPILGYSDKDRVLSPLPLFHVYALTIAVLSPLATGAEVFIMDRFSTQETIERLEKSDFTLLPGVPTMFHYLMLSVDGKSNPFKGLRMCLTAGAILSAELNKQFEERFGVQLIDGYGITEMSTMVTMNWPGKYRQPGSCGLPIPGLAIRVVDVSTGIDVPFGSEGELIARGPTLMLGYNRKPAETDAVIRNGWYHTGDLARSDKHGFLTITGRAKEIIIRGGQNISPAEVEETLCKIDGVIDCAVIGVKHDTLGEVPCAFIVARDRSTFKEDLVKQHCGLTLSSYKVPAVFRLIDDIPRTKSGKIMRFKLKELYSAEDASQTKTSSS